MGDIIVTDRRLKLSDNFLYYELIKSSTASRYNIDNEVTELEIIENAKALAKNCLEKIRARFGGFSPNSWYRGEELEKAICWGGRDDSSFGKWCNRKKLPIDEISWSKYFALKSHPRGEGADVEKSGVPNDELFEWCKENLEFDQLIREFPKPGDPNSGWVHISWSRTNNRQQSFTIG